ncbi:hypothetical protein FOFC_20945, partial [Fusarium oxysporum]
FNFTAALTTSNDTVLLVVQLFRAIDTGCLTVTGRAVIAGPWGMDDSNRMRRQNEPPAHSNPNQRYSLNDTSRQRRSLAENSNNRYRPASLAGPSSSGRGMRVPGSYSSYYSELSASFSTANMPGTAIAYGSEYGHDSRRTQGFGGYSTAATMMYNVGPPSLNLDDTNLHADRIQLWNDFNHAWLGLGQRQIVLMTSPQQLSSTQSLVSKAMIKKMGNELIRLCDGIERHGLVDYQYGVWEDQITAVLEDCLDLYDASEEGSVCGNW